MKSTLVVLCGETMSTDDPRREGARLLYLGISVGAMLSIRGGQRRAGIRLAH
jgi:dipeptide/tripeptide permease